MNIKEATQKWVKGFNSISESLIERAFVNNIDDWHELTPVTEGDYVYYDNEELKVVSVDYDEKIVKLEKDENIIVNILDINYVFYNNEKREVIDVIEDKDYNTFFKLDNDVNVNIKEIKSILYDDTEVTIANIESNLECEINYSIITVDIDEVYLEHDSWLPMWNILWTFDEAIDEYWAKEHVEILAQCGFRIFEDEETGDIYFGIDGCGYDFYEKHWIPLYKARGLHWHD